MARFQVSHFHFVRGDAPQQFSPSEAAAPVTQLAVVGEFMQAARRGAWLLGNLVFT